MAKGRQARQETAPEAPPLDQPLSLEDATNGLTPPLPPVPPDAPQAEKALTPDPRGFRPRESALVYTCEGQFSYPLLFNKVEGRKFQVMLLIPQETGNVDDIVKAVEAVGKVSFPEHWTGHDGLKYTPIKDGAAMKQPHPGFWVIQPKSDERPGVFYPDGQRQITDRSAVYGGCWGEVSLVARSYCFTDTKTGEVAWGVALVLKDVKKTRDDVQLGKTSFRPGDGSQATVAGDSDPVPW
jgi:hypothetical protein